TALQALRRICVGAMLPLMRALALLLIAGGSFAQGALAQDGAALFETHCSVCHRPNSTTRAPLREALAQIPRTAIVASLETGGMKTQGAALSASERRGIAAFLSSVSAAVESRTGFCTDSSAKPSGTAAWNGWGVDLANTRFQPLPGLTAEQVPVLKLKWAFGFPNATSTFGQPSVAGGRVFLGSEDGTVYALDARTGCIYWIYKAAATVRTAVSIDASLAAIYFGDVKANAYRVDAASGTLVWKVNIDSHPFARVTGAPKLHGGRLYVPVSSIEEVPSGNAKYPCCSFRGSIVALDTETGKQVWKTYAIPDPPKSTHVNSKGTQMSGPAGAAIWSSPTLDLERKAIYVATGNGYADPPVRYTDAILSLDMETGGIQWARQMTEGDGWNFNCLNPNRFSCPEHEGPDLDFGSSPILRTVAPGKRLLLVGQKSGMLHAIDPDAQGKIVWQVRIGKGGSLGGIEWGPAADEHAVYAALSDIDNARPEQGGGLFAIQISTGEKIWYAAPPKPPCLGKPGCTAAQMAPVTVIPNVVFSGSMDGHLRAYSTAKGQLLWDFDTLRSFDTVNGVKSGGGSLNATGPTVAGGMLYVNSGYGQLGGLPGNVLLAFAPEH
ncbi:MAG TPA: PQQ-binding-like beta-propeller repeat protein, partial [Bryobacteraceae bacterium]|nr:PQQ-binding-like beta-propeller repeat protein [Bryobacteraceae bacterium]